MPNKEEPNFDNSWILSPIEPQETKSYLVTAKFDTIIYVLKTEYIVGEGWQGEKKANLLAWLNTAEGFTAKIAIPLKEN